MKKRFSIKIGKHSIRFTPEGKVAVLDAIKTLSESNEPELIWESLKHTHPELSHICTKHRFGENQFMPVVDTNGWDKIEDALMDYVFEHGCWTDAR